MAALTTERLQSLLPESSIFLAASAATRDDAVQQAGEALVAAGAVDASYITAMLDREHSVSTYVGEGIAMPHGTVNAKDTVSGDALVLLQFPEGIDWDGEKVTAVIGVAARGRGYIS
ncbi:MAG: system, component (fructose/mannitol), partial [Glaciihabitans sp.]|nr:system, component (fructose/mannitol) [Glaciihabitans sp.]